MIRSPADQAARDKHIRALEIQGDRASAEAAFVRLPKGSLLLNYQAKTVSTLMSGVSMLVIDKSRRIGLTWGVASYAVIKSSSALSAGGQNFWYMGYDLEMAREFIEVCAMWARAFNVAIDEMGEVLLDEDAQNEGIKAFSIRFASGFRITALPSVPRALRGKQGIFCCDEAAFHKNVEEVLKAATAFLIWGGQVIVISTHDGVGNQFAKLCGELDADPSKGARLTITFADAMADGLYERVAMVAATKNSVILPKAEWEANIRAKYGEAAGEELDCIPRIGSGSLISIEDIVAAEHDDCGIAELYSGGICYVGRDVARRRDGQVQYCMELIGDVLWQRDTYEEAGQSFAHQDAFFNALFATRRIGAAWIDQTGMGEKVVEDLRLLHGDRVHGELLTGPHRVDIALALKKRFEERSIRIRKDALTRADLMAIKKVGSEESGGMRIVNDGTVHADRFWAYGLACRAAELPPALYRYQSVAKGWDDRQGGFMRPDHRGDRDALNGLPTFGAGAW